MSSALRVGADARVDQTEVEPRTKSGICSALARVAVMPGAYQENTAEQLRQEGYTVDAAASGAQPEDLASYDVAIVVVGADPRGLIFVRELRALSAEIVIIAVMGDGAPPRRRIFEAGADMPWRTCWLTDIVFAVESLISMRAVLRARAPRAAAPIALGRANGVRVVFVRGREIDLTQHELRIMERLLEEPNQIVPWDALRDAVWPGQRVTRTEALYSYLSHIKEKLGAERERLVTVRGLGLCLELP